MIKIVLYSSDVKFNVIALILFLLGMHFCVAMLLVGFQLASADDANCEIYHQIIVGRPYTINSPNWPGVYGPGVNYRWVVDCPAGYRCQLRCAEFSLPESESCSLDRVLVSVTGDTQLSGAQVYCGTKTIDVLSIGSRLTLEFLTNAQSPGGRFTCQVFPKAPSIKPPCQCGHHRKVSIVGGNTTLENEFPSMVGLADMKQESIVCGGVIISPWHVLTAAHCVVNQTPKDYAVIVGIHNISMVDSPARKTYVISYFNDHPLYDTSNNDYDISIATVATEITFSDRVGPACLPFKYRESDFTRTQVIMLGWGTLSFGGKRPDALQKVAVDVISPKICRSSYTSVTCRQMCTFTPKKDACQFDSGGPLLYLDQGTDRLYSVGIISSGQYCAANRPALNTRVTALLNWITENTPGVDYCVI